MKRTKKVMLAVLATLSLSLGAFASCNKTEEKGVALVNFTDETIEVELGTMFSVKDYLDIYDENDVLYGASVEIKDSNGNDVSTLGYEFVVEDETGYTLVITARHPETGETVAMRTLALKVVDTSAPLITIGDFPAYGVVGEDLKIPVRFMDASADYNTNVLVERIPYNPDPEVADYDESLAQSLEVGYESKGKSATFTPEKPGQYKITVEAWDGVDKAEAQTAKLYRSKSVWATVRSAYYEADIETFETPDTVDAAYVYDKSRSEAEQAPYQRVDSDGQTRTRWKEFKNANAKWHEEYAGKFGVLQTDGVVDTEYNWTKYYVMSSTRDAHYYSCGASDTGKATAETTWQTDERWDYVSVWTYVAGNDGETVNVRILNNIEKTVNCNEWFETRAYKETIIANHTHMGTPSNVFGGGNHSYTPLITVKDNANRLVYVDQITYERNPFNVEATYDFANNKMKINVTKDSSVKEELSYTYTVTDIGGNPVTLDADKSFAPTSWLDYTFTVSANVNGTQESVTTKASKKAWYKEQVLPLMADNEIEGFYHEASRYLAPYGVTDGTTTPDKNVPLNENKTGYEETFNGKNGVLWMNKSYTHSSGAAYNVMSSVRSTDFYGSTNSIAWTQDASWDYLSIWMYIEKPEGETAETTTICRVWGRATVTVPFDTWFEYKLTKEALSNDMSRPFATLSGSQGTNTSNSAYNGWNVPLFYLGGDKYQGDYKVFVDSISYEKHDVFEVTATQNEQTHEITVTINPNEGITLADFSDINYRIVFRGNEQAKNIQTGTTEALSFTFTPNPYEDRWFTDSPSTTETYGICVTLTYNDVKYTGYYNISGVTYAQQTAE